MYGQAYLSFRPNFLPRPVEEGKSKICVDSAEKNRRESDDKMAPPAPPPAVLLSIISLFLSTKHKIMRPRDIK